MSAGTFNAVTDPSWTGHCTRRVTIGTLDDAAESNLYDPPIRYLRAAATGTITVTLHSDDTADAAKKVTYTFSTSGQELGVFAIRKIWATGTTVAAANLVGAR